MIVISEAGKISGFCAVLHVLGCLKLFQNKSPKKKQKSKMDFISEYTNKILGRTGTYKQSLIFN